MAEAMRQLQFMVFEALSNVLQHAQASELRIEAVMTARGVQLRIIDNGRGFDVDAPPRKGLHSHARAGRCHRRAAEPAQRTGPHRGRDPDPLNPR